MWASVRTGAMSAKSGPGPPPRNHAEKQDPNVRIIYELLSDGLAGQSTACSFLRTDRDNALESECR